MKQLLIAAILCTLTLTSVYAGGTKGKKDQSKEKDIKVNIHIDKNGDVQINGKNISDKEIEKWVNDHLANLSLQIDAEPSDTDSASGKGEKKTKTVELSLTIKEK